MFEKIFAYVGDYRRYIWAAMGVMLIALIAYVAQYAFLFQIIRPLLEREPMGQLQLFDRLQLALWLSRVQSPRVFPQASCRR